MHISYMEVALLLINTFVLKQVFQLLKKKKKN